MRNLKELDKIIDGFNPEELEHENCSIRMFDIYDEMLELRKALKSLPIKTLVDRWKIVAEAGIKHLDHLVNEYIRGMMK